MSQAHAETVSGRATVIDGATLEVRGVRILIAGIEAPADDHVCARTDDNRWRCGPRTITALDELLEESIVTCAGTGRDPLGRLIAACSVGPIDLSLWLVRNGFARASAVSNAGLKQAEGEAKAARRGIGSEGGE